MTATLTTQQAMLIKNAVEKLAWKYHTTADQDATSTDSGHDTSATHAPGSSFTRPSSGNRGTSGENDRGASTSDSADASRDSSGDPSDGSDRSGGSSGGRGASFTRTSSGGGRGASFSPAGSSDQAARAAGGWGRAGRAGRSGVGLGACRAQALVDLLSAQAQVSAQATVLVPVNTPDQALVAHAIDGLSDLLAAQGMILSISSAPEPISAAEEEEIAQALASLDPREDYPEHEPGSQGSQEQPAGDHASGDEDPEPGSQEPEPGTPADHTDQPAAPPWGPCSDDPITEHATTMDQLADRLNAITNPLTHPAPASPAQTGTDTAAQTGTAGQAAAVDQGWRAGHPDDVTIEGVGIIHAETVTGLINAFGTTIGRALTDPVTGTLWEHTTTAYRPPRAMQAFIRLRDQVCRFPGCTRPADYTDGDHLIPYADGGPTTPANLVCLCRSHHRAKASGAWTTRVDPDGTLHWTALNNHTLTTYPAHEPIPF